jgi:hypothetical protein
MFDNTIKTYGPSAPFIGVIISHATLNENLQSFSLFCGAIIGILTIIKLIKENKKK